VISGCVVKSKQADAQGHEGYAGKGMQRYTYLLSYINETNGKLSQTLMATSGNKDRKGHF